MSIASQVRKKEKKKEKREKIKRRVMESKCPGGNPGSS